MSARNRESQDDREWRKLREQGHRAHAAAARAGLAIAEADEATATYNRMLAQEHLRRGVPQGWALDIFGDGRAKPVGECKPMRPVSE